MVRVLIFCFLLVSFSHVSAKQAPLLIGHIDHPIVASYYRDVVAKAYNKLGIAVEFIEVGSERGLILLDKGVTDADVLRYKIAAERFKNIIPIQPALASAKYVLYCMRQNICDKSVLLDKKNRVASTLAFFENFKKSVFAELSFKAEVITFDSPIQVRELVLKGRFDFAILPSDKAQPNEYASLGVVAHILGEAEVVHLINKKHAHLKKAISAALLDTLAQMTP